MTIMSLIVLKEMFEVNCKGQEKRHIKKKKKKPYFSGCGDGTANKSAAAARMMVCGSPYENFKVEFGLLQPCVVVIGLSQGCFKAL